jgi:hypothetical protein
MDFIFWVALIGLLIAIFQDIKRNEIDDWLNYLLFSTLFSYFVINNLFNGSSAKILFGIFFIFLVYLFDDFILYRGGFFAAGDNKLLFALSPIFILGTFYESAIAFFSFVLILIFAGGIYGLFCTLVLFIKGKKKSRVQFKKLFLSKKILLPFIFGVLLLFLGFFSLLFSWFGALIILFCLLYSLAKAVESVSLTTEIFTKDLVPGDWLAKDMVINKRKFRYSFEGLSEEEILFLRKHKKKVLIKKGIPFAPVFLISFLIYSFCLVFINEIFINIFSMFVV